LESGGLFVEGISGPHCPNDGIFHVLLLVIPIVVAALVLLVLLSLLVVLGLITVFTLIAVPVFLVGIVVLDFLVFLPVRRVSPCRRYVLHRQPGNTVLDQTAKYHVCLR